MAQVVIENVTKRFGPVRAVDGVSLEIPDGAFVILVGPSGCGKTTLLRLLAGLEFGNEGRILIGGRDVTNLHPRERDIAMVFQSYALYPHMSVRRNLSFALELRRLPHDEIERRVRAASEILGIEMLLDRQPRQLSGGQRQRVAVGRAIVREPAVFLFDEPLSNLDAKLRTSMRSELIKLHKRLGTTIVYVTHDQVEAMTMGELVVVMNQGLVQQIGPPLQIYNDPNNLFVAEFIGSPAMNLFPARIDATHDSIMVGDGAFTIPLGSELANAARGPAPTPLVLGIRPEHFAVADGHQLPKEMLLDAQIEVVEPLGAETIIEVDCKGIPITARLRGDAVLKPGAAVRLGFDSARVYLFEEATGRRVRA
jgi:multiple sugar transport system ATP-binding protein